MLLRLKMAPTRSGTPSFYVDAQRWNAGCRLREFQTAYTVTVEPSQTINADSLTFADGLGNVTVSGGTIHIADATSSILMNSDTGTGPKAQIITSVVSGTNYRDTNAVNPFRTRL